MDCLSQMLNPGILNIITYAEAKKPFISAVKEKLSSFSCKTYLDIFLAIGFKFLTDQSNSEISESACQFLIKISNLSFENNLFIMIETVVSQQKNLKSNQPAQNNTIRILFALNLPLKLVSMTEDTSTRVLKSKSLLKLLETYEQENLLIKKKILKLFNSLIAYYIKYNIAEEIIKKLVLFHLKLIINESDFSGLFLFKELLFAVVFSECDKNWVSNELFTSSENIFKVMILCFQSKNDYDDQIQEIKEILSFLSKEFTKAFIDGILNFLIFLSKNDKHDDIKIINNFIPCFEISLTEILEYVLEKINEKGFWVFN